MSEPLLATPLDLTGDRRIEVGEQTDYDTTLQDLTVSPVVPITDLSGYTVSVRFSRPLTNGTYRTVLTYSTAYQGGDGEPLTGPVTLVGDTAYWSLLPEHSRTLRKAVPAGQLGAWQLWAGRPGEALQRIYEGAVDLSPEIPELTHAG